MRTEHLSLLRSPLDGSELTLRDSAMVGGKVETGTLTDAAGNRFPIHNFIPRFVPEQNYCDAFTYEWERYPDILSSYTGYEERFAKETRWGNQLGGQLVLEAGCGLSPFTGQALATGCQLVSFDYSGSVEQNYAKFGGRENLLIVQANISAVPTEPNLFDMLAPAYDLPATIPEFLAWHQAAGLQEIEVGAGYNGVEGRGVKPL